MALYVPRRVRRRRLVIGVAAAVVIGLVVGGIVGRTSAPSVADEVLTVRESGSQLAARVGALPIEYEQAVAGTGDTVQKGVIEALDGIDADAKTIASRALWLTAAQRLEIDAALADVRDAARTAVTPPQFEDTAIAAAKRLRTVLGSES